MIDARSGTRLCWTASDRVAGYFCHLPEGHAAEMHLMMKRGPAAEYIEEKGKSDGKDD